MTGAQIDALPEDPLPSLAGVASEGEFLTGASIASLALLRDGSIEIIRTDEQAQESGGAARNVLRVAAAGRELTDAVLNALGVG